VSKVIASAIVGVAVLAAEYITCTFLSCIIVFTGEGALGLAANRFRQCTLVFEGPAAETIQFLAAMYKDAAGGGRELVENTLQGVRSGAVLNRSD